MKLCDASELAFKDLMLLINTSSAVGSACLVCSKLQKVFLKGKYKLACDMLVNKYASHSVTSLLKWKSELHNRN